MNDLRASDEETFYIKNEKLKNLQDFCKHLNFTENNNRQNYTELDCQKVASSNHTNFHSVYYNRQNYFTIYSS